MELEHCDTSATIMFIHSMGGGTGSGLGTRITEEAADEVFIWNQLLSLCFRHYKLILNLVSGSGQIECCRYALSLRGSDRAAL